MKDAANGRLGREERCSKLSLKFTGGKQVAQHGTMRTKDVRQARIKLELDALARLIKFGERVLKCLVQAAQFAFNIILADRVGFARALEYISNHPSPAHRQTGRNAASRKYGASPLIANDRCGQNFHTTSCNS
jgi:hypothetical protein